MTIRPGISNSKRASVVSSRRALRSPRAIVDAPIDRTKSSFVAARVGRRDGDDGATHVDVWGTVRANVIVRHSSSDTWRDVIALDDVGDSTGREYIAMRPLAKVDSSVAGDDARARDDDGRAR